MYRLAEEAEKTVLVVGIEKKVYESKTTLELGKQFYNVGIPTCLARLNRFH